MLISVDPNEIRTPVHLSLDLLDLGSFQEISMTFRAKFYIQLRWFDSRLTFTNLRKDNDEKNSIGKAVGWQRSYLTPWRS